MKKLIPLVVALFLLACESGPKYKLLKYEEYDIPAKSQIETRILLMDSLTKKNVTHLLQTSWNNDSAKTFKYHPKPTHIFIYVYKDSIDYKNGGGDWIGMMSRVSGKDYGIQLKEEYLK